MLNLGGFLAFPVVAKWVGGSVRFRSSQLSRYWVSKAGTHSLESLVHRYTWTSKKAPNKVGNQDEEYGDNPVSSRFPSKPCMVGGLESS